MSARPLLNRAYIMIAITAALMLAAMLGGIALRKQWRAQLKKSAPPIVGDQRP